jgi:hypothetical protein
MFHPSVTQEERECAKTGGALDVRQPGPFECLKRTAEGKMVKRWWRYLMRCRAQNQIFPKPYWLLPEGPRLREVFRGFRGCYSE